MSDHRREACERCPLESRRDFMRDTAAAVAGVFTALGLGASEARAMTWRLVTPLRTGDEEHAYPIPAADGAMIDKQNQLIIVRWLGKVYGFNLSCPHQNTALHWEPEDNQFQCPKHHSRYQPDGIFISGRATRGMDRFGVRRDGDNVVVDVDKYYRQDENAAEWTAAFLTL
ncbi:MAG TPA: Rieske 2Fe-2S domain-containing protein [Gemmatimonadales bacterium]|nr:Rieske 2Fe-2S domain-containing protein [Gemmatimonadales bacterium]